MNVTAINRINEIIAGSNVISLQEEERLRSLQDINDQNELNHIAEEIGLSQKNPTLGELIEYVQGKIASHEELVKKSERLVTLYEELFVIIRSDEQNPSLIKKLLDDAHEYSEELTGFPELTDESKKFELQTALTYRDSFLFDFAKVTDRGHIVFLRKITDEVDRLESGMSTEEAKKEIYHNHLNFLTIREAESKQITEFEIGNLAKQHPTKDYFQKKMLLTKIEDNIKKTCELDDNFALKKESLFQSVKATRDYLERQDSIDTAPFFDSYAIALAFGSSALTLAAFGSGALTSISSTYIAGFFSTLAVITVSVVSNYCINENNKAAVNEYEEKLRNPQPRAQFTDVSKDNESGLSALESFSGKLGSSHSEIYPEGLRKRNVQIEL